jgi:hypothetical protein
LKSAVAGDADELEMNIPHPTSSIQHPVLACAGRLIGCWIILPFIFFGMSVSAQTSTNALPALSPAYPEMPPTFWEQHEPAIIVVGFSLLAVAFLFLRVWLRPETPMILPPEVLTRGALTQLLRQPEDGKLLSKVSRILRRYVAAAFELPGGELTTAEFSAALAGSEKVGAELAQIISSFLRECDERKFSPDSSSAPLNAVNRALELVQQIEKRRAELRAQAAAPK